MPHILEPAIHFAVERDGLPRVAQYDDGVDRVLYLEGEIVHTMEARDWPPPLPTDPTPAEIAAAIAARAAERAARSTEAAQLRQQVIARAQAVVGVRATDLTAAQLRDLFVAILWDAGALNPDLTVRALRDWMDR